MNARSAGPLLVEMTPLELIACMGVMFGFGVAALQFGIVAVTAYWSLVPLRGPLAVPPAPALPRTGPRQITYKDPHPSARCPVCRTAIQGQVRVCPRCRVLSHEDCWEFQGGCAIFGCCEKTRG